MKMQPSHKPPQRPALPLAALIAAGSLAAALDSQAASQTWTNAPVSQSWTNVLNWQGKAVPGSINITGNTTSSDVVTLNQPIPGSGIGGAALPIQPDDATTYTGASQRTREINGITYDTVNCGAYYIQSPSPVSFVTNAVQTGVLWVSHNGAIRINPPVTNSETILVPLYTILPSSTAGFFNLINNSTNPNVALYISSITHGGATTRGTTFVLDGTNAAVNVVTNVSQGASAAGAGAGGLTKQGLNTWEIAGPGVFLAGSAVNVNNGTLIVQDPAAFGSNVSTTPAVNSNAVLQINGVTLNQSVINMNGGTLRLNGTATVNGVHMSTTLGAVATLATTGAGDVMTVGNAANQPSGGAANTVLHVAGPGTVLLSQSATYVGKWSVDAGTLQLGNTLALGTGPNVNIGAGATLDATPITVSSGTYTLGTAALSASGTGTTAGTAATLKADATGSIDLASTTPAISLTITPTGFTGDTTHPALYVASGTLSLSGNAFSIVNAGASPLGNGTYKLIQQATGNITAGGGYSVVGVTGNGVAAGSVASVVVNNGEVDLVVAPYVAKNLVWTGGSSAIWDIATNVSWLNGSAYTNFHNSDNVTFNAVGSTNPTVNLVGTISPGSVIVDTTANNYTFAGGNIAGGASLVKKGAGTLVLSTANTYGGGTTVSNGVIQITTANAIPGVGAGNLTVVSPGTVDLNGNNDSIDALAGNGTVDTVSGGSPILTVGNNDNSGTFSGSLQNTAGTLALTKNGNGTQTLSGANTYTGATTLNAGTLAVANYYALGSGLSPVTINNGVIDMQSSLLIGTLAGAGTIENNSTTTLNTLYITNTSTYNGVIADGTGGGTVDVVATSGTLRLNGTSTYTGGTYVGTGVTLALGPAPGQAGTGGIIVSNGATVAAASTGSTASQVINNITTVSGAAANFTGAGAGGDAFSGAFIGDATTTNVYHGQLTLNGNFEQFSNFLGVVQFVPNATVGNRINTTTGNVNGGDNTTFDFEGGYLFNRNATTVSLGAIIGGGPAVGGGISGPTTGPATFAIGSKGISTEFAGVISGNNNIVKVGADTLTLDGTVVTTNTDSSTYTNYLYAPAVTYVGNTTVSNGVLSLSAPDSLSNSPSITLAASSASLNVTHLGFVTNFNDALGNADSAIITNGLFEVLSNTPAGLNQSLSGIGSITGNLLVDAGATLNIGLPLGTLTVTGTAELAGTNNVAVNATTAPNCSELVAAGVTIDSTAILVVTNLGVETGAKFQLFNHPVSFATVVLPTLTGTNTWVNNLAVDGSITLVAPPLVNTVPTNVVTSFSNGVLSLSWPLDHVGWRLLSQTANLANGVSSNTNDWTTVTGSAATNAVNITVDPTKPGGYYRLVYP